MKNVANELVYIHVLHAYVVFIHDRDCILIQYDHCNGERSRNLGIPLLRQYVHILNVQYIYILYIYIYVCTYGKRAAASTSNYRSHKLAVPNIDQEHHNI